jgi:hypothetical protein
LSAVAVAVAVLQTAAWSDEEVQRKTETIAAGWELDCTPISAVTMVQKVWLDRAQ